MPFDAIALPEAFAKTATSQVLSINVRMPDGGWLAPAAEAGSRVMDVLRQFGVPVRADCDGSCACTHCRARFGRTWRDRLPPPSSEENALLAELGEGDGDTRLLCGLVVTPDLDGLEIELHWDALEPQTYWVAG